MHWSSVFRSGEVCPMTLIANGSMKNHWFPVCTISSYSKNESDRFQVQAHGANVRSIPSFSSCLSSIVTFSCFPSAPLTFIALFHWHYFFLLCSESFSASIHCLLLLSLLSVSTAAATTGAQRGHCCTAHTTHPCKMLHWIWTHCLWGELR